MKEDCINKEYEDLPREYKELGDEIERIVEGKITKKMEDFSPCIDEDIENAKNIDSLNLVFDKIKIFRSTSVNDIIQYLKSEIKKGRALERFGPMFHKIFPYGQIKPFLFNLIETAVDKTIAALNKISTKLINKVKSIANDLKANGFSITVGFPVTLTITLNYDSK